MTKGGDIFAAVDLGTNSFRLLIAERSGHETIIPLVKDLITVRLGQGLQAKKTLTPEAMERGLRALRIFSRTIQQYRPQGLLACGTHALRLATNREEFLGPAATVLKTPITILSGEEEALLSFQGAASFLELPRERMLLADVGGGSTELIYHDPGKKKVITAISLPLGAVDLTESCPPTGPLRCQPDLEGMRHTITTRLGAEARAFIDRPGMTQSMLVGTGGTATALAALALGLKTYDADLVQGSTLSRPRLKTLLNHLASLDPPSRAALPGLDRGRGDIIVAGAVIYQEVLRLAGKQHLLVSDAGLLEGILLSAANMA